MPRPQIALQLYTLRDYLKAPADAARTLRRVKAIGYDHVQLSALGPIEPAELKRILDGEGLGACATHTSFERLQTDFTAVVAEHHLWQCPHVGIPSLPPAYRDGPGFGRFAREASALARRLKAENLTTSYHNHSFELERFDGRTGLETLLAESDPSVFFLEIDTYWIQHGGGDPAAWIHKAPGRQPLIHLKDMAVVQGKPVMAEVGEGNLNWPAILDAGRAAGVEWYIVEQDHCQRDPFESIAISLRNLRGML